MTRRLPSMSPHPELQVRLQRGILLRVDSDESEEGPSTGEARAITFQYNPETITRSRSGQWEARTRRNQPNIRSAQDQRLRDGSGSAHLLAESETISMKLVFDATEALLNGGEAETIGVLPELAFLETTSMGRARGRELNARTQSVRAVRPDELLLVLGGTRTFPVVITSLTITEQRFLPDLTPIRAEVDLRFNVLEPVDVTINLWVPRAFEELVSRRRTLSESLEVIGSAAEAIDNALSGTLSRDTTDDNVEADRRSGGAG